MPSLSTSNSLKAAEFAAKKRSALERANKMREERRKAESESIRHEGSHYNDNNFKSCAAPLIDVGGHNTVNDMRLVHSDLPNRSIVRGVGRSEKSGRGRGWDVGIQEYSHSSSSNPVAERIIIRPADPRQQSGGWGDGKAEWDGSFEPIRDLPPQTNRENFSHLGEEKNKMKSTSRSGGAKSVTVAKAIVKSTDGKGPNMPGESRIYTR